MSKYHVSMPELLLSFIAIGLHLMPFALLAGMLYSLLFFKMDKYEKWMICLTGF